MQNLLFLKYGATNTKLKKSSGGKYLTTILNLAPHSLTGIDFAKVNLPEQVIGKKGKKANLCPGASKGCMESCLYVSGMSIGLQMISTRRELKTRTFLLDTEFFMSELNKDIKKLCIEAEKQQRIPTCRLNGTSDIRWDLLGVIQKHPNVQFYDYTKRTDMPFGVYPNYHLTFSMHENNLNAAKKMLDGKISNVAVVFGGNMLPKTFLNLPVIDGDKGDLRFLDPNPNVSPVIIGLRAKHKAKTTKSGFAI